MLVGMVASGGERMSCSKWSYEPQKCDGDFCPGECDDCPKCYESEDEE